MPICTSGQDDTASLAAEKDSLKAAVALLENKLEIQNQQVDKAAGEAKEAEERKIGAEEQSLNATKSLKTTQDAKGATKLVFSFIDKLLSLFGLRKENVKKEEKLNVQTPTMCSELLDLVDSMNSELAKNTDEGFERAAEYAKVINNSTVDCGSHEDMLNQAKFRTRQSINSVDETTLIKEAEEKEANAALEKAAQLERKAIFRLEELNKRLEATASLLAAEQYKLESLETQLNLLVAANATTTPESRVKIGKLNVQIISLPNINFYLK